MPFARRHPPHSNIVNRIAGSPSKSDGTLLVTNRDTFARNWTAANRSSAAHHITRIIIGILAGFLAGQIVKGSGMGILIDLLVGMVGSIIGGGFLVCSVWPATV
jgi:hypothetical protein